MIEIRVSRKVLCSLSILSLSLFLSLFLYLFHTYAHTFNPLSHSPLFSLARSFIFHILGNRKNGARVIRPSLLTRRYISCTRITISLILVKGLQSRVNGQERVCVYYTYVVSVYIICMSKPIR